MYLLGAFRHAGAGTQVSLTAPPATRLGDWAEQGLAFYAGSVSYLRTITPRLVAGERLFVQIPEYRGAAVRVWVDGQDAGLIAWQPSELDITTWSNPAAPPGWRSKCSATAATATGRCTPS